MGQGSELTFFQKRHTDGQQVHEKMLNVTNPWGTANQNRSEILPHPTQDVPKQQEMSFREDVGKRELSCTVGGKVNWCGHYGNE